MASSFAKLVASNPLKAKSVALFRPVAIASSRFCSTINTNIHQENNLKLEGRCSQDNFNGVQDIYNKARSVVLNSAKGIQRDGSGECIFKFKNDGSYTSDVPDVFNSYLIYTSLTGPHDSSNAVCPRLSAIHNMSRLLHLMDIRVGYVDNECYWWDVMEDAEALYLVRNISSLPRKDVDKLVYHSPTGLTTVFGTSLRVFRKTLLSRSVEITVGRQRGYRPNAFYPGYTAKICLPASLYMVSDIKIDVKKKVFKMTIPKVKGKWIRSITVQINLHSTIDDPIYYQYETAP